MTQEIIGFDFGHGETAVCRLDTNTRGELMPDPLLLGDSQSKAGPIVTAVAEIEWDGGRRVLVGQDALAAPDASRVRVAFKSDNFSSDDTRVPVQQFVGRIAQHILESRVLQDPDAARFVFGAPSGWSKRAHEEFRRVVSHVLPSTDVRVVPESRAAFAYAAHAKEIDFDTAHTTKAILLVDLGSSTIDITTVDALNEAPIDIGEPLGAGRIERLILRRMLEADTNIALRAQLEADSTQMARCEAECRKAKEEYYDAISANGTLLAPIVRPRPIPGGGYFVVELDEETMRAVEATPIEEFDGASWFQRLEQVLRNAHGIIAARNASPEIVLLTGGASRMPLVREVAMKVFGADVVRQGTEPGLAIARGLAIVGNIDRRVEAFQKDVDRFVRDVLPELVKSRTDDFADRIAAALTEGMTERLVVPEIRRWVVNEHKTLNETSAAVERALAGWLQTAECEERLGKVTVEWFNEVSRDVRRQTESICERHGMPKGTLTPPAIKFDDGVQLGGGAIDLLDDESLENFIVGVSVLVAGVVATVAFGGGVAMIATTGVGTVFVAAVMVFLAVAVGMDNAKAKAQEWAQSANIPPGVRRLIGGGLENRVQASADKIEAEAAEAIKVSLAGSTEAVTGRAALVSDTIQSVEDHLRAVANRVAILIT